MQLNLDTLPLGEIHGFTYLEAEAVTVHRSGRTYCAIRFWQSGSLDAPMEYLNYRVVGNLLRRLGYSVEMEARSLRDYWHDVQRLRTSANGVYGFKMFIANYVEISKRAPTFLDEIRPNDAVYLTRREDIGQAMPYFRAQKSKVWFGAFIWMDTIPVGVIDNGVVTYIHADALDTPRATANAAGSTTWTWAAQSNPFGEVEPQSLGYHLSLRFPGQYADDESHLVYNNYRYHDPASGRYLESDPAGLDGGPSTYAYGFQDPLDSYDPLGLAPPGHHEFPQSIWKGVKNLSNDARTLFRDAVVNPANRHGWSKQHAAYNRIAQRAWDKFCKSTKADVENMSKETAEGFMDFLRSHPEVARFNAQIQSGEELTTPDETAPINEPPAAAEPAPPPTVVPETAPVKVEDPLIMEMLIP